MIRNKIKLIQNGKKMATYDNSGLGITEVATSVLRTLSDLRTSNQKVKNVVIKIEYEKEDTTNDL